MQGKICGVLAIAAIAGMALSASGQIERGRTRVEMAHTHVARLPYTAEYKVTHTKTLANGSTISHESTEVVAVDAQGRRMTSTTAIPLSADQTPVTRITVSDPIAHTNLNWNVPGQKVTVMTMPMPGAAHSTCAVAATAPNHFASPIAQQPEMEDLGMETFQGVEARGHRTITTIPAGKIGNNAPIQRTSEEWRAVAPGLTGLVVRQVTDDPQAGTMNKELVNFTQAEPDAALFQPPADYEIVNKEAPVCPGIATSSPSTEGTGQSFAPIQEPPAPPEQ
ncbi:MAG TPA: hypothetical protein VGF01_15670 [Terracidiphilus sp.]|jgi:hypothetical protein